MSTTSSNTPLDSPSNTGKDPMPVSSRDTNNYDEVETEVSDQPAAINHLTPSKEPSDYDEEIDLKSGVAKKVKTKTRDARKRVSKNLPGEGSNQLHD